MTTQVLDKSESPRQNKPAQLHWERAEGMSLAVFARPHLRELHLTLVPTKGETVDRLVDRLAEVLKRHGAVVARQLAFGPVAAHAQTLRAMRRRLGPVDWPARGRFDPTAPFRTFRWPRRQTVSRARLRHGL